jgi:hypothetical protein
VTSGTSVGPTVALSILLANYAKIFMPLAPLKKPTWWFVSLATVPFKVLDRIINRHPESHRISSGTFVHAVKQGE